MSNCCANIYDLGCFSSCDTVELPMLAPADDTYKIIIDFNGQLFEIEADLLLNDPIEVQAASLNECYVHKIQVFDSNGDVLLYNDGTTDYDCFKLKTKPKTTI